MTMVTFMDPNRIPVLVADSLISGSDDESALTTPDHPHGISTVFPRQSGFVPTYLARKTSLINSNLAIAMSGGVVHMRAFREDVQEYFRNRHDCTPTMSSFFFNNTRATRTGRSYWTMSTRYCCRPAESMRSSISIIFLLQPRTCPI